MSLRSFIRSIILENFLKTGKYLYHSSNPLNRDSISKEGLVPKREAQWMSDTEIEGEAIFATDSEDRDDHFDSTYDDDFWRIDTTKCPEVKWRPDPNFEWGDYKHVYTQQSIPRHALKLMHKGTGTDTECGGTDGPPIKTWWGMR